MSVLSKILAGLGIGETKADTTATPTTADTSANAGVGGASTAPVSSSPPSTGAPVDINEKLEKMAEKHPGTNWKISIVDLLKVLDIDSSLTNRQNLAKELNYTGSTDDSATMNVWLHKAVLKKVSENGGQVPADLRD
ncbi:DUF3597 domain-containing protein [Pseudomonas sp. NPDC087358]|uniref:DUF3597 domain-containing protein n=1 Tax=Pseudomonas sp. NPDC087358 TaxID=3364439 RepID=UPI00384B3398